MKLTTLVPLIAATVAAGCIHTSETVVRDDSRTPVEFENDTAGRLFYETLSRRGRSNREESTTDVSLPLVFEHKVRTVRGPNIEFNEAVSRCDTNHDGKITETEARIFAGISR
ncbi:MAG TPA: hypothetical protein VMF06_17800 [Candidatus Limnocylindria bacterium]|nr:hypothetical protein [Candidatus Limnocylindria bacterium]